MSEVQATAALLHLSAAISVLSLAYLGLDKADLTPDELEQTLDTIKNRAEDIRIQFSLTDEELAQMPSSKFLVSWKTVYPACIICYIAKAKPVMKRIHKIGFFFYAIPRIPLINAFRDHINTYVMMILAAIATFIFVNTSIMEIFNITYDDRYIYTARVWSEGTYQRASAVVLVVVLLFAICTAAAAKMLRPKRLLSLLAEMAKLLEERLKDDLGKTQDRMQELLSKIPGAGGGA